MEYDSGLAAVGPFKGRIPRRNIIKVIALCFQRVAFRIPGNVIVARATGKFIAFNNS